MNNTDKQLITKAFHLYKSSNGEKSIWDAIGAACEALDQSITFELHDEVEGQLEYLCGEEEELIDLHDKKVINLFFDENNAAEVVTHCDTDYSDILIASARETVKKREQDDVQGDEDVNEDAGPTSPKRSREEDPGEDAMRKQQRNECEQLTKSQRHIAVVGADAIKCALVFE